MKWEQRSHIVFIRYMQRVQGHSSLIQHAQNHENITFDICNIDYKIWTNSKGYSKVLKFQYLQAMQICLNKLQKIFCWDSSLETKQMYTESYYSTTTWERQRSIWLIKMFFQSLQILLFMINFYYSDTLWWY